MRSKLTPEDDQNCLTMSLNGDKQRVIAKRYNVAQSTISNHIKKAENHNNFQAIRAENAALKKANQALQATNESLISSNEALQATNDKLMLANKALQATNDKLMAANQAIQIAGAYSRNSQMSKQLHSHDPINFAYGSNISLSIDQDH